MKQLNFLIQKISLIQLLHTNIIRINVACATTHSSNASQTGSAVIVEDGIYFVRGAFVEIQNKLWC